MHKTQNKILQTLSSNSLSGMTYREIGEFVDERHPQKLKHHILQLKKKGLVKFDGKKKILEKINRNSFLNSDILSIPIVGSANCGPAEIFAEENIDGFLKISKKILDRVNKNLFAIRAFGISMDQAKIGKDKKSISEGDYVIVDSEDKDINDNDYILAVIDGMGTIKKLVRNRKEKQLALVSESSRDYSPIILSEDDHLIINGKIIQVIKNPINTYDN